MVNYYDVLGVPRSASAEEVKKAYREQIRFFHPDVFRGNPEIGAMKTQQLNEAYEVLSDPQRRADYDWQLHKEEQKRSGANLRAELERTKDELRKSREACRQAENQAAQAAAEKNDAETKLNNLKASERKRSKTMLTMCLAMLLLVACMFYQNNNLSKAEEKLTESGREYAKLANENEKLQLEALQLAAAKAKLEIKLDTVRSDLEWLENSIGVITDGIKNYHHIDCSKIQDVDHWYMHNINYCENVLNYAPCPDCW